MSGPDHDSGATPVQAPAEEHPWRDGQVVPVWLVLLVAGLLVAVMGVTAFLFVTNLRQQDVESAPPQATEDIVGNAYSLQELGKYAEAVEMYDRALKRDPEDLGALYNRGISLLAMGEDRRAVKSLSRVLELAPEHVLAAKALGEYYQQAGRYERLGETVQAAARANPSMADLRALYGLSLEKTGRVEEALVEYEAALDYAPDLPLAKEGRARLTQGDE